LFGKILVPLDGSEFAEKALNYAIELGKMFSSELLLVHIVQSTTALVTEPTVLQPTLIIDLEKQLEANGQRILSSGEAKAKEAGVKASSKMDHGNPADKLLGITQEEKVDLIVMGDRGLGRIAHFFLGSVVDHVSHHAHCPVLIVK
jgi:nucleotide-binding universal stress UspA family protein